MAIRHIKSACTLTYEGRKALEEEMGISISWPHFTFDRATGEVSLGMPNGKAEQLGLFYIEHDEMSHEGRVVAMERDINVRIMSDVWADLTFAVVYEPTREHTGFGSTEYDWTAPRLPNGEMGHKSKGPCGYFRRVQVDNSEFQGTQELIVPKVDASPEILELYEAWKRGQAFRKADAEYDRQERALQEEKRAPVSGKWVRVTSGRKVALGTEGIIFWSGDSQWGPKVGIALPMEDGTFRKVKKPGRYGRSYESYADVAWTATRNVEVISGPGGRIL